MIITFTPSQFEKLFAVYKLINTANNHTVFIWYSKAVDILSLTSLKSNPAFDANAQYTLQIMSYHLNLIEAQNAAGALMQREGMPDLNKTLRWNRKGPIICNETGQKFRNQAEAVQMMGINQSRLCQHLRGVPGYKTVKGLTFSFDGFFGGQSVPVQPTVYPGKQGPRYYKLWDETTPGGNVMSRKVEVTKEQYDALPENSRFYQK